MSDYFNKNGKPIELLEWAKLLDDTEYKRVAETTLPDGKWISTVWLGLNHSFKEGPPLIFETIVFPTKGEWGELDMARYSTLEEAIEGHEEMVNKFNSKEA